jgi:hypothetical protein
MAQKCCEKCGNPTCELISGDLYKQELCEKCGIITGIVLNQEGKELGRNSRALNLDELEQKIAFFTLYTRLYRTPQGQGALLHHV